MLLCRLHVRELSRFVAGVYDSNCSITHLHDAVVDALQQKGTWAMRRRPPSAPPCMDAARCGDADGGMPACSDHESEDESKGDGTERENKTPDPAFPSPDRGMGGGGGHRSSLGLWVGREHECPGHADGQGTSDAPSRLPIGPSPPGSPAAGARPRLGSVGSERRTRFMGLLASGPSPRVVDEAGASQGDEDARSRSREHDRRGAPGRGRQPSRDVVAQRARSTSRHRRHQHLPSPTEQRLPNAAGRQRRRPSCLEGMVVDSTMDTMSDAASSDYDSSDYDSLSASTSPSPVGARQRTGPASAAGQRQQGAHASARAHRLPVPHGARGKEDVRDPMPELASARAQGTISLELLKRVGAHLLEVLRAADVGSVAEAGGEDGARKGAIPDRVRGAPSASAHDGGAVEPASGHHASHSSSPSPKRRRRDEHQAQGAASEQGSDDRACRKPTRIRGSPVAASSVPERARGSLGAAAGADTCAGMDEEDEDGDEDEDEDGDEDGDEDEDEGGEAIDDHGRLEEDRHGATGATGDLLDPATQTQLARGIDAALDGIPAANLFARDRPWMRAMAVDGLRAGEMGRNAVRLGQREHVVDVSHRGLAAILHAMQDLLHGRPALGCPAAPGPLVAVDAAAGGRCAWLRPISEATGLGMRGDGGGGHEGVGGEPEGELPDDDSEDGSGAGGAAAGAGGRMLQGEIVANLQAWTSARELQEVGGELLGRLQAAVKVSMLTEGSTLPLDAAWTHSLLVAQLQSPDYQAKLAAMDVAVDEGALAAGIDEFEGVFDEEESDESMGDDHGAMDNGTGGVDGSDPHGGGDGGGGSGAGAGHGDEAAGPAPGMLAGPADEPGGAGGTASADEGGGSAGGDPGGGDGGGTSPAARKRWRGRLPADHPQPRLRNRGMPLGAEVLKRFVNIFMRIPGVLPLFSQSVHEGRRRLADRLAMQRGTVANIDVDHADLFAHPMVAVVRPTYAEVGQAWINFYRNEASSKFDRKAAARARSAGVVHEATSCAPGGPSGPGDGGESGGASTPGTADRDTAPTPVRDVMSTCAASAGAASPPPTIGRQPDQRDGQGGGAPSPGHPVDVWKRLRSTWGLTRVPVLGDGYATMRSAPLRAWSLTHAMRSTQELSVHGHVGAGLRSRGSRYGEAGAQPARNAPWRAGGPFPMAQWSMGGGSGAPRART